MRTAMMVLFAAGCYRGPDPAQPEPLVLYTSGPRPPTSNVAAAPTRAQRVAANGSELILLGSDMTMLDASRAHSYDRICVQDRAHITVDGSTRIELSADRTTVIGGAGIGPLGASAATIEIKASGAPEIFVLFDNERAPIRAVFDTPNSTVHVGITGKTGLDIGGQTRKMVTNGGWGLPPSFPTCDAAMDRDPVPSFPPSRAAAKNCTHSSGTPSNYTTPQHGDSELHVIGVYEGDRHVDGIVDVHVPARKRPVVLALTAYQPTIWRIDSTAKLAAVYLYGYEPQRIEGVPKGVRVNEVTKPDFVCTYGWEAQQNTGGCYYQKMIATVRKAAGLVESSFQGCYAGREFEIPLVR
jgi:hypothetical protein